MATLTATNPPVSSSPFNNGAEPQPNGQRPIEYSAPQPNGRRPMDYSAQPQPNGQRPQEHSAPQPNGQRPLEYSAPRPNGQRPMDYSAPQLQPSRVPDRDQDKATDFIPDFDEDDYIWSWQDGEDWIPFDSRANGMVERAYFNGEISVALTHDFYAEDPRTVYFDADGKFVQVNVTTRARCKVQRIPEKARTNLTITWEWNDGTRWIPCSPDTSSTLEHACALAQDFVAVNTPGEECFVDFNQNKKINSQTNESHDIRRTVTWKEVGSPRAPEKHVDDDPYSEQIRLFANGMRLQASGTTSANSTSNNAQSGAPQPSRMGRRNSHDTSTEDMPQCPICFESFPLNEIVAHVNVCLEDTYGTGEDDYRAAHGHAPPRLPQNVMVNQHEYDPVTKEKFDCPICMEEVNVGAGYQFETCSHKYCGGCLNGYFSELIMNGRADDIPCPHPNCEYKCTYDDVRFIVERDLFDKYVEFRRLALVNKDAEMRWCPNPTGCGNAARREDKSSNRMLCTKCNYEFCFECAEEYHGKKSCEDFAKWKVLNNRLDIRIYLWQKLNTKACPQCAAKIQKRGGCNHMTCQHCDYEFCWQCSKPYTSSHFDEGWCTMYGKSPTLYYAKEFGKRLISALPFLSLNSGSSSDDSDDDTFGERLQVIGEIISEKKEELGEKWEETKEGIADQWEVTKVKANGALARFKSLFDKS